MRRHMDRLLTSTLVTVVLFVLIGNLARPVAGQEAPVTPTPGAMASPAATPADATSATSTATPTGTPGATPAPPPPLEAGPPPDDVVIDLVERAARFIWNTLLAATLRAVTDLAETMYHQRIVLETPADWTYAHPVVRQVHVWLAGLMTSAVALVLLIGALFVPLRHRLMPGADGPGALLTRVAWGLLGIWTCLPPMAVGWGWGAWLIELANSLVIWLPRRETSFAQLIAPLAAPTAANQYGWLAIVLLLVLGAFAILYIGIACLRLGALGVLLVTAPFFLLCWMLAPTRHLAGLWVKTFVLTVILQLLQLVVVGLTVGVLGPVATGEDRALITPILGLAGLWAVIRLPRELGVSPVGGAMGLIGGLVSLPRRTLRRQR